jgi:4-amino-4-deoxy-L-arabinose transferase-like glycosyltransferase
MLPRGNQMVLDHSSESRGGITPKLLAVFFVALAARLFFLVWRGAEATPDTTEYLRLAHNIFVHGAFSLDVSPPLTASIRHSPLYPVFLAALGWCGLLSPIVVVIIQALLDAVVAVLVLLLTRIILPLRWALAAALVYSIHPGAIFITSMLMSESLFTFLQISAVALLVLGVQRNRLAITLLAGIAIGLAILCRAIAIPVPFLFSGVLLFWPKLPRQRRHALLLLAGAILVVTPWTMRCSYISRHLVLVQGFSSAGFYAPTLWFLDQRDYSQILSYMEQNADPQTSKISTPEEAVEADHLLFHKAIQNIRANPGKYLASRSRAFPYLFISSFDKFTGINASFGTLWAQRDVLRLALKLFLLILFSLIPFALGVLSLVWVRRNLVSTLCAIVWVYTWFIHLPMWIEYRFWAPVVPFLLVNAAAGAFFLWGRFSGRLIPSNEASTT